ncbi:hypothetical protein [Halorarum halobium]|uniref:hypothetical protein n=1 Tax=Halorarum halobium TaxID=3075121 RepID=UPI0028A60DF8|nr:hypothetical protein [Halobaculum sp. XH14]
MTDTHSSTSTEPTENRPTDEDDEASGGRDLRYLLNRLALAGLVLLALVAGLRFYLAASTTIDRWVVREYRSLFHAVFNLALLLLAGYGISVQVRRLR